MIITGLQRADGMNGALVVRQPKAFDVNGNTYQYDEAQHYLVVTDWTNLSATSYSPGFRSTVFQVDSVLVNGFGNYVDPDTRLSNNGPQAVVYCERNTKYRFRFINSCNQNCPLEVCVSKITYV